MMINTITRQSSNYMYFLSLFSSITIHRLSHQFIMIEVYGIYNYIPGREGHLWESHHISELCFECYSTLCTVERQGQGRTN